jgi:hypothetical protein
MRSFGTATLDEGTEFFFLANLLSPLSTTCLEKGAGSPRVEKGDAA